MTLARLIEHPRHIIPEEMQARGWDDDALIKGMDPKTALAALLYIHVAAAERVSAGNGVWLQLKRGSACQKASCSALMTNTAPPSSSARWRGGMGEDTVKVRFPVTTCTICGNRDWRHYAVLDVGTCCERCLPIAKMKAERARIESLAAMMRAMTFDPPPKPSLIERALEWWRGPR